MAVAIATAVCRCGVRSTSKVGVEQGYVGFRDGPLLQINPSDAKTKAQEMKP